MIGTVFSEAGLLKNIEQFKLVKKIGKKDDLINKHNHPEAFVTFTVVSGKVKVNLSNEEKIETHELIPGKLLNFDGNNYIDAVFLEDSEVFVTLITK